MAKDFMIIYTTKSNLSCYIIYIMIISIHRSENSYHNCCNFTSANIRMMSSVVDSDENMRLILI
jgi:hypothetical protein